MKVEDMPNEVQSMLVLRWLERRRVQWTNSWNSCLLCALFKTITAGVWRRSTSLVQMRSIWKVNLNLVNGLCTIPRDRKHDFPTTICLYWRIRNTWAIFINMWWSWEPICSPLLHLTTCSLGRRSYFPAEICATQYEIVFGRDRNQKRETH